MASKWTKEEEVILKNNFSTAKWDELLKMLPEKKEDQIIKRAYKLGINREEEIIDIYYDEEKEAWVEKKVKYKGTRFNVNMIYPSPKGIPFEIVKKKVGENVSRVFAESIHTRYLDFITTLRIDHSEELYSIFFDMEKEMFTTNDETERLKVSDKYRDGLLKAAIKTIEKKKCQESDKLKEQKKKER